MEPIPALTLGHTATGLRSGRDVAVLVMTVIDYRFFRAIAYPSFAFCIVCLVVVLLVGRGQEEYGARRWIPLGFFDFQPSEVTKVTMILALARWLGINPDKPPGLRRVIASGSSWCCRCGSFIWSRTSGRPSPTW